ncbi:MAG: chorismate synthase [Chloroflexi bacterium]|nr:chorismate synthase [Chloroflexota bacterium]MCH8875829.1 chorismate synthase [Chloroflexota bacterium]MCI0771794.1 chorismate synthase [Chloroflexota bacterium]MCI0806107.1 chorismate synthase [Chloroflexota bacterium]MCI0826216.1 chorismate synthase [Chloroflexota bacterium]
MLRFLTAGESHGPELLAIVEGIPAGLALTEADLLPDLARRQVGFGVGPRMKSIEQDEAQIVSGVLAGLTIGAPIGLRIINRDHTKWKGQEIPPMTVPRPGHADQTAALKYGYPDLRFSLERASARETAARVAVGAVCRKLLAEFGISIGSYVTEIGTASAEFGELDFNQRFEAAERSEVRCPTEAGTAAMREEIRAAMQAKDTLGGVFEVVALNAPPGLGSHVHWDRRLGGRVAAAMMSIHAMKGVEIGPGFENARMRGTQVHDEFETSDERVRRRSNRAGGLEGGITTGDPLIVRVAMKPISTTLTPRASVDLATGQAAETRYERSDFCSVPRAAVVGEAMLCIVLAEALLRKLGGDSVSEMKPRFDQLPRGRLDDFKMVNEPIIFWD